MTNTDENLKNYLKEHGLKVTRERLALFEGVKAQTGHFTVDDLVHRLKEAGYKVSRDTVYRNLPVLMDTGVLRISYKRGRDTLYEVLEGKDHHDHIFCLLCGKLQEFRSSEIESLQHQIAKEHGFDLTHHFHQLVGICSSCKSKTEGESVV